MKRRRRSESKEKSEEKEGTLSKRRSSAAAEELEEVDSIGGFGKINKIWIKSSFWTHLYCFQMRMSSMEKRKSAE